jgi:hypothetical protein
LVLPWLLESRLGECYLEYLKLEGSQICTRLRGYLYCCDYFQTFAFISIQRRCHEADYPLYPVAANGSSPRGVATMRGALFGYAERCLIPE